MADSSATRAPGDPPIKEEELDASIEDNINPNPPADSVDAMNLDGTNEVDPVAPATEPKIPVKKDASLREFMSKMDDYAPIVSCEL
jgi:transcription initiation factor TFIID subunit 10